MSVRVAGENLTNPSKGMPCEHYRVHLQSAGFQDQAFNFAREKTVGIRLINEDLHYKHKYL